METILGIKGKDFVMVAADCSHGHSIMVLKDDESKIHQISDKLVMATIGESGDTVQFTEYISKNILLYRMRNGYELTPKAAAHFTRKNLAEYLRTRTPYHVNLFVAGFDEKEGSELHYIDYLANAKSVRYAGQGYGGMFTNSIFDRYYHDNVTQEEAYDIFKKCVKEIQKRLIINLPNFKVTVVDKNGVKDLPMITARDLDSYDASS
ncbi:proteasome subunit beta type-2 [Culicoides brevitarsis]|uniref:proteasome subunit beta type-2 n=1 Tax=Culicoides brevitarsis TaxID=469753 RepID=UPI00307C794F